MGEVGRVRGGAVGEGAGENENDGWTLVSTPFLTHCWLFRYAKDPRAFIERCRATHGGAFMAKLVFRRIVFLDASYQRQFFTQPESRLSFREAMRQVAARPHTAYSHPSFREAMQQVCPSSPSIHTPHSHQSPA